LGFAPVEGGDEFQQPATPQGAANLPPMADDGPRKAAELKRLRAFVKNGTYLQRKFASDVLTGDEIDAAILGDVWASYP